jgi:hypothetical protein
MKLLDLIKKSKDIDYSISKQESILSMHHIVISEPETVPSIVMPQTVLDADELAHIFLRNQYTISEN